MIEKNKQTIEVPTAGQSYVGKHGEKLEVISTSDSAYARRGWTVFYHIIGPSYSSQQMELQRFMQWAKDDPDARPMRLARARPISHNPFSEAKSVECNREGRDGCSATGWDIDGKYHCGEHYYVSERVRFDSPQERAEDAIADLLREDHPECIQVKKQDAPWKTEFVRAALVALYASRSGVVQGHACQIITPSDVAMIEEMCGRLR